MSSAFEQRRAGLLLHPTSLPSGVLDGDVDRWLEVLKGAGCGVWQVLPLGEPTSGKSPYHAVSAFAINPALMNDFGKVDTSAPGFQAFCDSHEWLDDYALFIMLREKYEHRPWTEWKAKHRKRDAEAMEKYRSKHEKGLNKLRWQQFRLHQRWAEIRQAANDAGILLFGDMPLFVAHNSVDVWATPKNFRLDDEGNMEVVTGVPPDYYSETGQLWGNPHYDWEYMKSDGYDWWLRRIGAHLELFDMLRLDHFRGLQASWVVDGDAENALNGHWEEMPGDELLRLCSERFGDVPVIAEDLGFITDEVTELRTKYELPGMAVLHFGFDAHGDNPHRIINVTEDRVVYTGTHDNDTTIGWFLSLDDATRVHVCEALGLEPDLSGDELELARQVCRSMIDAAMRTPGKLCIIPLQDLLEVGADGRMNVPGTIEGNWGWSFAWEEISNERIDQHARSTQSCGRT